MPMVFTEPRECPILPISPEADMGQCPGLPLSLIFGLLVELVMES